MPIRRDHGQLFAIRNQQQPIKIITDILLRHSVLNERNQIAENFLRQPYACRGRTALRQARKETAQSVEARTED